MDLHTAQSPQRFSVGEKIPYFCLQGTDGKIYTPNTFAHVSALVVIFMSNHCPYARLYEERVIELHKEFESKNVHIVCICSNDGDAFPEDSFENMKLKNYPFPYLHDATQVVARSFDAQTTPEVFLFDNMHTLRYHGAIDNNPESKSLATCHYVKEALEAILAGGQISKTESPLIGCSLKWKINV